MCGLKVWVAREDFREKLEGIPALFSDLENILKELHFSDETSQSRGRGLMVLLHHADTCEPIFCSPGASLIADSLFVNKLVSTSNQVYKFLTSLKGLEIVNSHSGSQIPKITKEIECLFQSESSVGLFSSNYEEARLRTQRPVTTNTNTVCKITYMNILFYVEEMASTKLMYIR